MKKIICFYFYSSVCIDVFIFYIYVFIVIGDVIVVIIEKLCDNRIMLVLVFLIMYFNVFV